MSESVWPDVDVVMPIRNESVGLAEAVRAVRAQEYPATVRIFLAVGPSGDGTEQLAAQLAADDDHLRVIENPSGLTPSALNLAIRAGTAPVIVRVDGHSQLSGGYIERAVETMRRTGAVNVGGRQVPSPTSPFERAVADATTSWLGTGGASYRVGGDDGPVDTVFLGVFDRSAVESVGLFDEQLVRNQDYELNIRLRRAGGVVWFDPELAVGYRPRGSWKALGSQYFDYGRWKAVVMRMHPESTRLRQLVPPAAVIGVVVSTMLGLVWRRPLLAVPAAYAVAVGAAARRGPHRALQALVLSVIHGAWGAGVLVGIVRRPIRPDGLASVRPPVDGRGGSAATPSPS